MEGKLLKMLLVLIALITLLTLLANRFSKLSNTWGQAGLFAAMLLSIYIAYKLMKIILKKQ